ncbi:MAG: HNH endonuclease [Candidatus Hodarchaeota archaeon]
MKKTRIEGPPERITYDLKLRIWKEDNYTCKYCGLYAAKDFETWYRAALTIDHVLARKHKGGNERSNLVTACHACNKVKGQGRCETIKDAKKVWRDRREVERVWFEKNIVPNRR